MAAREPYLSQNIEACLPACLPGVCVSHCQRCPTSLIPPHHSYSTSTPAPHLVQHIQNLALNPLLGLQVVQVLLPGTKVAQHDDATCIEVVVADVTSTGWDSPRSYMIPLWLLLAACAGIRRCNARARPCPRTRWVGSLALRQSFDHIAPAGQPHLPARACGAEGEGDEIGEEQCPLNPRDFVLTLGLSWLGFPEVHAPWSGS